MLLNEYATQMGEVCSEKKDVFSNNIFGIGVVDILLYPWEKDVPCNYGLEKGCAATYIHNHKSLEHCFSQREEDALFTFAFRLPCHSVSLWPEIIKTSKERREIKAGRAN